MESTVSIPPINDRNTSDPNPTKSSQPSRCHCFSCYDTYYFLKRPSISWQCIKAFILNNFLVLGLLLAAAFSLACPWPGRAVDSLTINNRWKIFQSICIIIIFIISGLTLLTDEVKDAIRNWPSFLAGIISIMLITPCAAFALVALPLTPIGYKYGLAIFALTPAAIASGVTYVRLAGGNVALAILLTILTNMLSVFILPYTVNLVLASGSISLQPISLMIYLILTIMIPTILGKLTREAFPWFRWQVQRHTALLGTASSTCLIVITWLMLSTYSEDVLQTAFGTLCLVVVASLLLHVLYLLVNGVLAYVLRCPAREAISILILASEKTLPMAVAVIMYMPASFGSPGQMTVSGVIANIVQIVMDAVLAGYVRKRMDRKENKIAGTMDGGGISVAMVECRSSNKSCQSVEICDSTEEKQERCCCTSVLDRGSIETLIVVEM